MFTVYATGPDGSPEQFGCQDTDAVKDRCRDLESNGYVINGVIAVRVHSGTKDPNDLLGPPANEIPLKRRSAKERARADTGFGSRWDFASVEHLAIGSGRCTSKMEQWPCSAKAPARR